VQRTQNVRVQMDRDRKIDGSPRAKWDWARGSIAADFKRFGSKLTEVRLEHQPHHLQLLGVDNCELVRSGRGRTVEDRAHDFN
jgi:hypothetical protein